LISLPKHHTGAERHQDDCGEEFHFHGTPDIQFNRWLPDIPWPFSRQYSQNRHLQEIQVFASPSFAPDPVRP
jgi:hypothetical protein